MSVDILAFRSDLNNCTPLVAISTNLVILVNSTGPHFDDMSLGATSLPPNLMNTNDNGASTLMATERQIEANRNNALKSTGPITAEGKASVSRNAWKHGMAAESALVDPAHAAEAARRRERWGAQVKPFNDMAAFALDRAVAASMRIELCEDTFDGMVVDQTARARLNWDSDRRIDAAILAEKLPKRPMLVARQLESTRQGAELMIEVWEQLALALEDGGVWDDTLASTALDLLGFGLHLRMRKFRTPLDAPRGTDPAEHRRNLAQRQIDRLKGLKATSLDTLDQLAQEQAIAALLVVLTKPAALVMRYESDAWRRYRSSMREASQRPKPGDDSASRFEPEPDPSPIPDDVQPIIPEPEHVPEPEPESHAPMDTKAQIQALKARNLYIDAMLIRVRAMAAEQNAAMAESEPTRPSISTAPLSQGSSRPNRHERRAEKAQMRRGG
jgi:hypothetical protein